MSWQKVILSAALAIVFVVSALVALFNAGTIVKAVLETYILKVENCRYDYKPVPIDKELIAEEPEETCFVDYNSAKRDIANGVGMFVVFAPIAWFMFGQTRKMLSENK